MRGSSWWGEPRPPRARRPRPAPGRGMLLAGSAGSDSADSLLTRRKGIARAGARCCRPAPRGRGGLLCGSAGAKSPLPGAGGFVVPEGWRGNGLVLRGSSPRDWPCFTGIAPGWVISLRRLRFSLAHFHCVT